MIPRTRAYEESLMSKTYRPYEPDQILLLPPSLRDWLPKGHLGHFIEKVSLHLDLQTITKVYEREERGHPPYNPMMMVRVLLYAYCVGNPSSRRIARGMVEDVAFRMLGANNSPDFRTIAGFRRRHLEALRGLFVQVLLLCQEAGLVRMEHVAIDGTKLKANASKHKAMSYARMKEEAKRLRAKVDKWFEDAEATDRAEDELYGPDKRGDEPSGEWVDPEARLKKIEETLAALEREAREAAEAKKKEGARREGDGKRRGRKPKAPDPTPAAKAQKNFTDPESRIMPSSGEKGSYLQGYNCQAAVDSETQVIVAADVTQESNDKKQAVPMLEQAITNTGSVPENSSMDAGYFSESNVEGVSGLGSEPFIPPDRQKHGDGVPVAPRGRIPKGLSVADRMRRKLKTKLGRAVYALRKVTAEPVFGQVKQGRGFRQFLLRGLAKVKGEWALICTGHNLLKLWRARCLGPPCGGLSTG